MTPRLSRACSILIAAAVGASSLALAQERRFTRDPIQDLNGSEKIIYWPAFMTPLGKRLVSTIPGIVARWVNLSLDAVDVKPEAGSGAYRLRTFRDIRDPERPTVPPRIEIDLAYAGEMPAGAPPPVVVLVDGATRLETRGTAELIREDGATILRARLLPPLAKLVPAGRRVYLNPASRYEIQVLRGTTDRMPKGQKMLPTFGLDNPLNSDTTRRLP